MSSLATVSRAPSIIGIAPIDYSGFPMINIYSLNNHSKNLIPLGIIFPRDFETGNGSLYFYVASRLPNEGEDLGSFITNYTAKLRDETYNNDLLINYSADKAFFFDPRWFNGAQYLFIHVENAGTTANNLCYVVLRELV